MSTCFALGEGCKSSLQNHFSKSFLSTLWQLNYHFLSIAFSLHCACSMSKHDVYREMGYMQLFWQLSISNPIAFNAKYLTPNWAQVFWLWILQNKQTKDPLPKFAFTQVIMISKWPMQMLKHCTPYLQCRSGRNKCNVMWRHIEYMCLVPCADCQVLSIYTQVVNLPVPSVITIPGLPGHLVSRKWKLVVTYHSQKGSQLDHYAVWPLSMMVML